MASRAESVGEGGLPRGVPAPLLQGAPCAQVIRHRVSYNQNDENFSRNSLMYMSKANLPIAVD